ncbi:MAG TPA: hypothetical protein PLD27_01020 [bacterium]|nr:hypothetical protein [bacterium]HPQ17718.1 hypothetical protein [bacterium]
MDNILLNKLFFICLIFELLIFLFEPILKLKIQSKNLSLFILLCYIFLTHFSIRYSGELFFLIIIPVISAALSYGVKGGAIVVFILFFLDHFNYIGSPQFHTIIENNLLKYISFFIISLVISLIFDENKKIELRCYKRFLNFSNSFSIENINTNNINELYILLKKIYRADSGLFLLKIKNNYGVIIEDGVKIKNYQEFPLLNSIITTIVNEPYEKYKISIFQKYKSMLKIDFTFENKKEYLLIFLKEKKYFTNEELELSKIIKHFIEVLIKLINIQEEKKKSLELIYVVLKKLQIPIIVLNKKYEIIFLNEKCQKELEIEYSGEMKITDYFAEEVVKKILNFEEKIIELKTEVITRLKKRKPILIYKNILNDSIGGDKIIISFTNLEELNSMNNQINDLKKILNENIIKFYFIDEIYKAYLKIKRIIENTRIKEDGLIYAELKNIFDYIEIAEKKYSIINNEKEKQKKLFNIVKLLEEINENVQREIENKNIKFERYNYIKDGYIQGIEYEIRFAILTFLRRAIKETATNKNVIIHSKIVNYIEKNKKKNNIEIKIIDEGKSLSEEEINNILKIDNVLKKDDVKIDYLISKMLIEKHNGKITIESLKNIGNTMIITLPLINI